MVEADREDRIVGRSAELERLEAAYAAACTGESRAVVIGGEAGIGKTSLVDSFVAAARSRGAEVLSGACLELTAGEIPYQPFVAALRTLTRSVEPGRLPALLGPARGEIGRLLPELGSVGRPPTAPDDTGAQARLFELILGVVERLARDRPVVVVIEDVQWADTASRDLLMFLVRTLRTAPVLFLATVRTDDIAARRPIVSLLAELERDPRVDRIELERLGRVDCAALFERLLGRRPTHVEVDDLMDRAAGNPFFIEQLFDAGIGERGDLPYQLRDIVTARIAGLSDAGQAVLRAASAAGRRLDDRLLSCVMERPAVEIRSGLAEVIAAGILVRADDDDDPETPNGHAFRHAILAEVIYEGLFAGERIALHAGYARCLFELHGTAVPAAELAFHWDAARDDDRALAARARAAREAERAHAYADALRHYERALVLWERVDDPLELTDGDKARLLLAAAETAVRTGEYQRAVALGSDAVAALDPAVDPVRAGEASERLRWFQWEAGDRAGAERSVREALDLLPEAPPSGTRARAVAHLAGILLFTFRWSEARVLADEAIAMAQVVGERSVEAFGLGVRALARAFLGEVDEGVADLRAALAIAVDVGSIDGVALGYANLAVLFDRVGRAEEALATAMEGFRQVERLGLARTHGGVMLGHAARVLVDLGRWDDADRITREGLERGAPGRAGVWLLTNRGRLEARRGDLAAASEHLAEARHLDEGLGGTEFRTMLLAAEAELAVAERRFGEVRGLADEGLAIAAAGGLPEPGLAWLAVLALRAEAELADQARARGAADTAEESADRAAEILVAIEVVAGRLPGPTEVTGTRASAILSLCHGEVSRIVGAPDPAPWATAALAWRELERPHPMAYARFREAEAILATRGPRDDAAAALREANDTAARLGAGPLLGEITLLARQARIDIDLAHPAAESGQGHRLGLTPREEEVLRLVAGGWTNQQIADELFISRKTASVHVSNILAKLGVDSRVEAAAIAHRTGLGADAPLPPDAQPTAVATPSLVTASAAASPSSSSTTRVHRTFLVSDVVGSTALLEAIGDEAWSDLRRWHDGALRAAFIRHGGVEVDHAGDGFLVVFEDAVAAIDCGVDIQRTLAGHRRTAGFAPSVRVAIHSGDAQRESAGYSGATLHVTARLAGLAGAGEIVASESTLAEAGRATPGRLEEATLRGVRQPVRVGRVDW